MLYFVFIGGSPAPPFSISQSCSGFIRRVCFSNLVNDLPSPSHILGLSTPYFEPTQPLGLCKNKYLIILSVTFDTCRLIFCGNKTTSLLSEPLLVIIPSLV